MTIRGYPRKFHSDNDSVSGRAKELQAKAHYILKMRSKGHLPSDIWRIIPEDRWHGDAHYAVFPQALLKNPIKASCPPVVAVLDPFCGTGSAIIAALNLNRRAIGIEIGARYKALAEARLSKEYQKTPDRAPLS